MLPSIGLEIDGQALLSGFAQFLLYGCREHSCKMTNPAKEKRMVLSAPRAATPQCNL